MILGPHDDGESVRPWQEELGPGAAVFHGLVREEESALLAALREVTAGSGFRHMFTPGGFRMSVAMTNCGVYGWASDRAGYRYERVDPEHGRPWPSMPDVFLKVAREAAALAGFPGFEPDACLINRYQPGAKLTLHQDKDERDLVSPIVSVSLGLPVVFQFGGLRRKDVSVRVLLRHGDVVVWGGPARLRYHGVLPLKEGWHRFAGAHRINLSFRRAG